MPRYARNTDTTQTEIVTALRWTLPWPTGVTTNHLYERMGMRRRLTPKASAWRDHAVIAIWGDSRRCGAPIVVPDGDLALTLDAYQPDRRRRDLDNLIKLAQDALALALGIDDSRVTAIHATKHAPDGEARLVVQVGAIG